IINRVHVPGPRQVLLQVKIAELNRTAIRTLGVSWLRNKDNSIMASTIGGAANIAGGTTLTQARPPFHSAVPNPTNTPPPAAPPDHGGGVGLVRQRARAPVRHLQRRPVRAVHQCSPLECPREDPGRTELDGTRRSARAIHRRRPLPLPRAAKFVDPRGNGRG